jgi:magnesium transporter
MKRKRILYSRKAGLPPESLVYTGSQKAGSASIEMLIYDESDCERKTADSLPQMTKILNPEKINLLIINNITDVTLIENLGSFFHIHPLVLEDVLNTSHLPKAEESGDQLLLTLKLFKFNKYGGLEHQQVSFILGEYYVLVLKDFEDNLFSDLETRIMNGKSHARHKTVDYLFYLLIDALIDSYYHIIDEVYNRIDKMEERLLEAPRGNYIMEIYAIKQSMSELRAVLYPVRESILNMVQGDYPLLTADTVNYLHDVKDHINHIIQMYESGRDTLSDLIELNSANLNNRLNGSMNLLTIITTLFIPLTLIAGIYGMNFLYMPELKWKLGYPYALAVMLITAGIMYFIMKRKKLL